MARIAPSPFEVGDFLTLGAFREMTADFDDHTHIVMANPDWYDNVAGVELPDDDGIVCVTLFPGKPYDTRQT